MQGAHTPFDYLLLTVLVIAPILEWRWIWPAYLKSLATGSTSARFGHYRAVVIGEWVPTLALAGFWALRHRPWTWLLLSNATSVQSAIGLACVLALIALLISQRRAILSRPKTTARVRAKLEHAIPLIPHSPAERKLFWFVSLTAGICEETLYRGFLIWFFAGWTGIIGAVLLSSLLFGFGHIYMGAAQIPKTGLVGLILAIVAVTSGSLWPAILMHAAIDWNSGELGFHILKVEREVDSL